MMDIDTIGVAIIALFIALGVWGFIYGLYSFTTIEKLSKRIENLENKVRTLI